MEFDFSRRIPQLDGLRGIAILLVLAFHGYLAFSFSRVSALALLVAPLSIGWSGVDLFFVLSGFLIGGILLDAKGSTNFFHVFYTRRFLRICPLYFAFLVVAASTYSLMGWRVTIPWWWCAAFMQNFWIARYAPSGVPVIGHTWSLAVEEQFYLVFPALLRFAKPRQVPKVVLGGIATAVVVRLVLFLTMKDPQQAVYSLLPCRADSFFVGVGTAWLLRREGAREFIRQHLSRLWLAMELLTVVCGTFFLVPSQVSLLTVLVTYDSLALLFGCVIAACLVDKRLERILSARWLRKMGTISYGVYLLQPLVWTLSTALPGLDSLGRELIALAATVCVAWLSWEYFEKPIVRLGHRAMYSGRAMPMSTVEAGSAVAD